MATVGAVMSATVTAPLVALGKSAIGLATDYQTSMNVLQATTQATGEQMSALDRVAVSLGADMQLPATSAKDAGDAMLELAKAGLTVRGRDDGRRGAPCSSRRQASSRMRRRLRSRPTRSTPSACEGSAATKVADMLAAGANVSSASVRDLAMGIQQGGVRVRGGQAADRAPHHLCGRADQRGPVPGRDGATALKNAWMRLFDPTEEATGLMQRLGVAVYDANGNMKQLPDIIDVFNKALSPFNQETRNAYLSTIFLSDGMKAMIPLLGLGKDGFLELESQVTRSGAASDLAGARMKGLGGALEGLRSQVETFLMSESRRFLDTLEGWVRGIADFIPQAGGHAAGVQGPRPGRGCSRRCRGPAPPGPVGALDHAVGVASLRSAS